jgi:hypothetical protein
VGDEEEDEQVSMRTGGEDEDRRKTKPWVTLSPIT